MSVAPRRRSGCPPSKQLEAVDKLPSNRHKSINRQGLRHVPATIEARMILVTGAAGFIGFHVSKALLASGERVLGIDNLNDYYDVTLKQARLAQLSKHEGFTFRALDVSDREAMFALAGELPGI